MVTPVNGITREDLLQWLPERLGRLLPKHYFIDPGLSKVMALLVAYRVTAFIEATLTPGIAPKVLLSYGGPFERDSAAR